MKNYKTTMTETINAFVNSTAFESKVRSIVRDEIKSVAPTNKKAVSQKGNASKKTAPSPAQEKVYKKISFKNDKMSVYTTKGASGKDNTSLRIEFAETPSAKIRGELKASGYRWHSEAKCWFVHNTEKAVNTARAIYKQLGK